MRIQDYIGKDLQHIFEEINYDIDLLYAYTNVGTRYMILNHLKEKIRYLESFLNTIDQPIKEELPSTDEMLEDGPEKGFSEPGNASRLVDLVKTQSQQGKLEKKNLIWLELTGCSGNIISLLDGSNPDFTYLISQMTNFIFNNSLSANEGQQAMEQLFQVLDTDYILVVEGAVATRNKGLFNVIGRLNNQPITALDAVTTLGEKAEHVIAIGACATHGGVSAARPNPAECVSVQSLLNRKVIQLPGCPCHPDWFMGTLAHILLYGEPELDDKGRPVLFYSTTIHERCTRRSFFDQGIFATKLGEKSCMFKLGCRGPITRIDCPVRKWNQYVNWPVEDDTPCIGCAQFGFPDAMEPFINYNTTRKEEKGE